LGAHGPDGIDAAVPGHLQVEDHQVDLQARLQVLEGQFQGGALDDLHLHARVLQRECDAAAIQGMVVDYKDVHAYLSCGHGSSRATLRYGHWEDG
jgi:hypothetical protein